MHSFDPLSFPSPKEVSAMRLNVATRTLRRPARPVRTRCRLELERLEDRSLLSFQVLTTLGTAAPGGAGFYINDFEPNGLNNHGQVLYGADLGTSTDPASFYGEGVFLRSGSQTAVLARGGLSA